MAIAWDKTLFDQAYDLSAEPDGHPNTRPGIRLHFTRCVMFPEMLRRARFFVSHFALSAADRVIVIGAAFGWTVEALVSLGIEAIGTDTSQYIFDEKDNSDDAEISDAITAVGLDITQGEGLDYFNKLRAVKRTNATLLREDSATPSSRNRVKRALSGEPTLIILENVATVLSDSENATLQAAVEKYSVPRICHFVTEFANPNAPFFFNSKSLAEWKAVFPTSTIIADGYIYRVA